ncbi:MAG: acyl-CoA dehydrogenase family protein [Proteobacteria bacterium]|nr:acyl-CoA dehydrogenase family protein [Pseudomonadota bacterium]
MREPDFYLLDELLTPEERMVRDTVASFVEREFLPKVNEHFDKVSFPTELVPRMAELGIFGANLKGYGCAGMNDMSYGLIMQELERGDSGLRSFATVQGALSMFPIWAFGNEEQKQKWLPRMARGEALGAFGLTEPDFGSNPKAMRTKAKKSGKKYILNGSKMWITNGTVAEIAVIWAQTEQGIRGFLVEKGTPGFTSHEIKQKYSLRCSLTAELFFEDCEIPEENILPGTKGLGSALACLDQARFGISFGSVGAASACYVCARDYALKRIQFGGKPIASHQLMQEKLADMLTEITKAQLVCLRLGRLKEAGKANWSQISLAKRSNLRMARDVARTAREILGAAGIVLDFPVIRHFVNLESVYTYEGTDDMHTLILGQAITGIPAFE